MEREFWFYVVCMIVLIIGNALQIGTRKDRDILNWFQIIIYAGVLIWYVSELIRGGSNTYFFFVTSILFLISFSIELWQFVEKQGKDFLSVVFLITSGLPIVLSIALLSGIFL